MSNNKREENFAGEEDRNGHLSDIDYLTNIIRNRYETDASIRRMARILKQLLMEHKRNNRRN